MFGRNKAKDSNTLDRLADSLTDLLSRDFASFTRVPQLDGQTSFFFASPLHGQSRARFIGRKDAPV